MADAPSYISNVPPELLAHIFNLYILGSAVRIGTKIHIQELGGPLLLCSVCMHWREICIRAPELWTSLIVAPRKHYAAGTDLEEGLFTLFSAWMTRTGAMPVDLKITRTRSSGLLKRILGVVALQAAQFRRLGIFIEPPFTALPSSLAVPRLEELSIAVSKKARAEMLESFAVAPKLRRVSLDSVGISNVVLPWAQLTHLSINRQAEKAILAIIAATPLLEVLSISHSAPRSPDFSSPITLSFLHTVRLLLLSTLNFLCSLTLPHLSNLEVHSFDLGAFAVSLLLRCSSQWKLRSLRIQRSQSSFSFMVNLLGSPGFLALEYLEITNARVTDSYIDPLLLAIADRSSFVPALRTLVIDQHPLAIQPASVAALLTARANLDSLRIFFTSYVKSDVVDAIQDAVRPFAEQGRVNVEVGRGYRGGSHMQEELEMLDLVEH
ncbi:hypothetical protein C8F01DRAFT_1288900 [Mycena amicta]|nr:hypothetical protein C8F01DRAFT_1288900 [Mycena amicta]